MSEAAELDLRRAVKAAEQAGSYLVCIAYQDREGKTITHFIGTQEFSRSEVFPTLRHWASELKDEGEPGKKRWSA